jgi:hypothetical protein
MEGEHGGRFHSVTKGKLQDTLNNFIVPDVFDIYENCKLQMTDLLDSKDTFPIVINITGNLLIFNCQDTMKAIGTP